MGDRIGQQFGNYRLERLLGSGGFAEVYLGQHVFLGTSAAIKVLHQQHMSPDDQQAFAQEARTVAGLIHAHIVRLLDFGFHNETPFLVMDYAQGGTLRTAHKRGIRLPLETVIDYVNQVAEALQFAHDHHLIHRDIKPENMLLGTNHEVLVGDFGIALAVQGSRAQSTQEVIGTAQYMAPEQILGKPHLASDQYALGIAAYEWLTGAVPFRGSFMEICAQHMTAPLPPLHTQRPDLHPDIENILNRALSKKLEERFANIRAFATALSTLKKLVAGPTEIHSPTLPPASEYVAAGSAPTQLALGVGLETPVQITPNPKVAGSAPTVPASGIGLETPVQITPDPKAYQRSALSQQTYEALRYELEHRGAVGPFDGALVIPATEQQIGQFVYLQLRSDWSKKTQKNLYSAQVQRYSIQSFSLTAAVFQHINANTYMAWADPERSFEVIIRSSKAILFDFVQAAALQARAAAQKSQGKELSKKEPSKTELSLTKLYKALCQELAQKGAAGPFDGALVIPATEQQVGQFVYLQLRSDWVQKTQKNLYSAQVQRYAVQDITITAAIFQHVSANTYMAWMDPKAASHEVIIRSSKVVLLDFSQYQ